MHSASVPNRLGRAFDTTTMHTAAVRCYFTSEIVHVAWRNWRSDAQGIRFESDSSVDWLYAFSFSTWFVCTDYFLLFSKTAKVIQLTWDKREVHTKS